MPTAAPRPPPPKPARAVLPDDGGMNFDFVEPPRPAKPEAPGGGAEMLDFVDEGTAVRPKEERKRPPPPVIARSGAAAREQKEETLSLAEEAPSAEPADAKKAEKERKKKEREERASKDREDRERRKAMRGPGLLQSTILPTLSTGAEALKTPKGAVAAVLGLALIVFLVFGFRARRTPAGLFWSNKFIPSKKAATATEAKVIEKGLERLAQGDFAGARDAVRSAAQLLGVLPDDEEVRSFFVLSASELKIAYAQVGGDWDQARRVVEKMKSNKLAPIRARGAFALAKGEVPKAKLLLAPLGDATNADVESAWLYAQALMANSESAKAAQVLDNALRGKGQGSAKLLLLRGQVARQKGQLADAVASFQKALEKSPDNGRALLELADVSLRQGDTKKTAELLSKLLDTELSKSLDATEEARANMLNGKLGAASHEGKAAEAAYERAVALDPTSSEIHESYGEFRLLRREWEKAARQFEAAIGTGHPSAAAYAGAARAYLGTNRLLEADKRVNEAILKEGVNAHYIYLQGRVAEAIGKGEEAFKHYEAALQKKPDLAEALAAEGMVLLSRGERAKAKDKLDVALKGEGARSSQEEEAIGDLALALGDTKRGREAYARALNKDPEDPMAHSGMGKALAAVGDLPAARKEMEYALSQIEGDAAMQYEYGSLLRRMGESDAALEALRKSVKMDSKDPRFRARLGAILVERGQYDEAEQQLRQAVLINDRFGEGLYFLARALAGRKALAEAVDTMKRAVEIESDNPEYLYHLGLIYEMGQQVQDAIDFFQKSIDNNPKNADAHEHLGNNLMVENRFKEAVAAFKKSAELDPRRARLWSEVGDAEHQSGDLDSAIRDFQRALAQDASLIGVWTKLGIAFKDKDCKGCRARALDALKRATKNDPTDATAHHELGYMLKDDNKRREAIAEFKRYLELRPDAGDVATVQDDIYYLQEESRRSP
jgi:tetratricopeptide (TPR) repeat protein